ncbi:MAG: efflux RND transporter permease subunit [Candidatus Sumerlaeia bacterium]|nr:efflux RND transporter permease subunit [Candidatus Sumerlaeia bacterium]
MFLSDLSVRRPVLAIVMSLLLVAFGILSYTTLPLREYPNIDPPIVSVRTNYPGASAPIVETKITQIIEDQISGVEGLRSIESRTRDGRSDVIIEFSLGRDIDAAANDVRDLVSRALRRLPDEADPPQVTKADSSASVMMWLNLNSSTMDRMQLTDYAERFLTDRLSSVDGVAQVRVGGSQRYSMRIWLDRRAMAARGLTSEDVERALRSENVELPAGRLESIEREFTVRMERNYNTPDDFAGLVLKQGDDGYLVRLADVARVEIASADQRSDFRGNGQDMVGLGVVAQSTANTLEVARGIHREMERIQPTLPEGTELAASFDSSVFVEAAIREVWRTLFIAMSLVFLVIFLFLGNIRTVLVPAVTVPVCLTATSIALLAMGFSINLLTLLALVLAIGLVVDDAIVVLENVHRRVELGEPPLLAAYRGTRQVGFAIIATTAVLVAVFVPLSFMQGNVGRLFREFALAMAAAVCFSSFVALTLSPVMCAKFLKGAGTKKHWLTAATERFFRKVERVYVKTLRKLLDHPALVGLSMASVLAFIVILIPAIPQELAPSEDRGAFFVIARTAEGASFDHAVNQMRKVEADLLPLVEKGEARRVLARVPASFGGTEIIDGGRGIVVLEDWSKRSRSTEEIIGELRGKFHRHPGARVVPVIRQAFGSGSSEPVQFVVGGPSYPEVAEWTERIIARATEENPNLVNLDTDYEETRPQMTVNVDRNRAADLGVSVQAVGRTLETMLGGRNVTTYIDGGEEYDVILQGALEDGRTPTDLENTYVRSERTGQLVPLSSLVIVGERADAPELRRYNRFRSITISANIAEGYTLGQALDYLEGIAREELPSAASIDLKGESREYRESSNAIYFIFLLSLIIVFLVLAAQFESFLHPIIIMSTVPLAVAGALFGLYFLGSSLNVYSQIGIVMLIGLSAKNGILIVEFANQLRDEGLEFRDALLRASATRLRPIAMTGISTAIGAIPLLMATGAGAESRITIGIVIFFGVMFASLLTLFTVPVFYDLIARYTRSPMALTRELTDMDATMENPDGDEKKPKPGATEWQHA